MSQTSWCLKHARHIHGDSAMGCSLCLREKHRAGHANSPEVIACAERIMKAIGKETPSVAAKGCLVAIQAIGWLEGAEQEPTT